MGVFPDCSVFNIMLFRPKNLFDNDNGTTQLAGRPSLFEKGHRESCHHAYVDPVKGCFPVAVLNITE
ncbi:MAG: hypothetical protein ACRD5B_04485 [Nitrososphaeraceae archaeon]